MTMDVDDDELGDYVLNESYCLLEEGFGGISIHVQVVQQWS